MPERNDYFLHMAKKGGVVRVSDIDSHISFYSCLGDAIKKIDGAFCLL